MSHPVERVREIAGSLGQHPAVVAVALAGSRAACSNDPASDFDLYVYANSEVPVDFRRSLAGPQAEIDNRFSEPGDEWIDAGSGAHFDVMYRSPAWIEAQLDRVLVRRQASIGYSTCLRSAGLVPAVTGEHPGAQADFLNFVTEPRPEEAVFFASPELTTHSPLVKPERLNSLLKMGTGFAVPSRLICGINIIKHRRRVDGAACHRFSTSS